jgi:hypothetical protein
MAGRSQASRRRGRSALLWAGATFLVVQLAVGLALDNSWPNLRFPYAVHVINEVRQCAPKPDIICVGSSRMGMCFRAKEIVRCLREQGGDRAIQVYNATLPRGDLLADDYVVEHLLGQGMRPAVLVVEVSPESLARYNEWLDTDILNQFTWAEVPRLLHEAGYLGAPQRRALFLSRFTPIYQYRRELRQTLFRHWSPPKLPSLSESQDSMEAYGWSEVYARLGDPARFSGYTQLMLPGLKAWLNRYQVGGFSARALTQMVRAARRDGIEVVLVAMPVTAAYRAYYTPSVQAQFHAYLDRFTQKYGCHFVDYHDMLPDDNFWDGYHALEAGGMRFSNRLATEVLAPLLRQRAPH